MQDDPTSGLPLPEHPELREIALAMEGAGISGEILDARWRIVFVSREEAEIVGASEDEARGFYGKTLVIRNIEDADFFGVTEESGRFWWRLNVPIMRRYLEAGDTDFEEAFGPLSEAASRVAPADPAPRAWNFRSEFPHERKLRRTVLGDVTFFEMRVNDDAGRFIGVVRLSRSSLPESLLARLGRGDRGLFERMARVSEPSRRPSSILFADLESSGDLSRRLSSRGYFALISGLTDLIDSAVVANGGIVGKHAGDGGSALFLAGDYGGSEPAAARAAIETARAIRDGAPGLGPDDVAVKVNIGLHWGATLMVGQVATRGRLEVTALGDQMNEGARIESAARGGAILASKELIERLDHDGAAATGIDPEGIAYTPLAELEGASEKAIRDAGAIPVAEI